MSRPQSQQCVRDFGAKLKTLRASRDMTLVELATVLGYSTHSHLSAVEAANKVPTVGLVIGIARFFDVTVDVLVDDNLNLPDLTDKGRTNKCL